VAGQFAGMLAPHPGGHARAWAVRWRGCLTARELLALRSTSGLGPCRPAPTAFNRTGEKLRATRGELPRVSYEVVLDA
jgi:hypothetical protein